MHVQLHMRYFMPRFLIIVILAVLSFFAGTRLAKADDVRDQILELANKNHVTPSDSVVDAIIRASSQYDISPLELTAIGILESGLGKYGTYRVNKNGTVDRGVFQVNSVNSKYCIEYNIFSVEGNALCAAKILSNIKSESPTDYLGRYHSSTSSKKQKYLRKVSAILAKGE